MATSADEHTYISSSSLSACSCPLLDIGNKIGTISYTIHIFPNIYFNSVYMKALFFNIKNVEYNFNAIIIPLLQYQSNLQCIQQISITITSNIHKRTIVLITKSLSFQTVLCTNFLFQLILPLFLYDYRAIVCIVAELMLQWFNISMKL